MSDALLPYYDRELNAIRRLAAEFAIAHPKIAGRLRLSPDSADDPHVARLLEGIAFLAARVHHRLDDEFPELIVILEQAIKALGNEVSEERERLSAYTRAREIAKEDEVHISHIKFVA